MKCVVRVVHGSCIKKYRSWERNPPGTTYPPRDGLRHEGNRNEVIIGTQSTELWPAGGSWLLPGALRSDHYHAEAAPATSLLAKKLGRYNLNASGPLKQGEGGVAEAAAAGQS